MKASATIEEPKVAKWLFTSTAAGPIWLVLRVWLGYQWLHAGWEKITGTGGGTFTWQWAYTSESWLKTSAGLKGFAGYALKGAGGEHAAVNYGWYAAFLRWIERSGGDVLAPAIAIGEFVIGAALIVGLFTAIAAFFGGVLNVSFGLSGVAGVKPGVLRRRGPVDPGLAERGVLRGGPVRAPGVGDALEAGQAVREGSRNGTRARLIADVPCWSPTGPEGPRRRVCQLRSVAELRSPGAKGMTSRIWAEIMAQSH
jgi:thiosulfate dehydrogenase [quinone] large subunit